MKTRKRAKGKPALNTQTIATCPERLKKKAQAIYDEKQIEFRKRAKGGWDILIYEPLASRVREFCHRWKISAREFVLVSLQAPCGMIPAKSVWKTIPETFTDGWMFGSYTRYADPKGCRDGDGFVIAPDGQRAELDWHVGNGKLKRTFRSDGRIWGVFEAGFPRPVKGTADLVENFRVVLPQIQAAFARHQKRHGRKPDRARKAGEKRCKI